MRHRDIRRANRQFMLAIMAMAIVVLMVGSLRFVSSHSVYPNPSLFVLENDAWINNI